MTSIFTTIDNFFFAKRAAWPFGLMRIGWAAVTLAFMLFQWADIDAYYTNAGFLPEQFIGTETRNAWALSLLHISGNKEFVWALFGLLLAALTSTVLGVFPRISVVISVVLLFSFHERTPLVLGGGDTVLRTIGFILMIAPGISALSLSRLRAQYVHWRKKRTLLAPLTMPAWPYRLLLWQMIVLYGTSLWWKLQGTMWLNGTAVETALHHPLFADPTVTVLEPLMFLAPFITWAVLAFEAVWILLLIPQNIWKRLRIPLKRIILIAGVLFHGSIALFMDVGSFSWAIVAAYLGLLDASDRAWLKHLIDRHAVHPIIVLYDGSCRLCRRSAFGLALLDTFKHLHLVNFRDTDARKKVAPHLSESQLDLAMHILLPKQRVKTGFNAFRYASWHLPALWPAAPFLYLPGISHLGRRVYAWVAKNRQKCTHDHC